MSKILMGSGYSTLAKKNFVLPPGFNSKASSYEGASTGRRLGTWGTTTAGPNSAVSGSQTTIRNRSRELVRNNPWAENAIDSLVANMIGTGIRPRFKIDDSAVKEELQALWDDWTHESDADGVSNFYGQETLVGRGVVEAGEILGRFRPRRPEDGLSVPLQIQLLEADHFYDQGDKTLQNGNVIREGIEINKIGRKVAYHLYKNHPGDLTLSNPGEFLPVRIPASEIMHVFKPLRIGQLRGMPWFSSVMVRLHDLDEYEDAELMRKKTAAFFAGFITKTDPTNPQPNFAVGKEEDDDAEGNTVIGFEPGLLQYLNDGEDIKFAEPADVGGNYEVWIKQTLHSIAAGIGCTYEQLTGDLKGVNYSSIRAGLLEFRRRCEMFQHNIIIHQFCLPVMNRWIETAFVSGAIKLKDFTKKRREYTRVRWCTPGWDWVDPIKDQLGKQMEVRNGFNTRENVAAELGHDVENIDKENKASNERVDKMGLIYDTDPRKTAKSGTMQSAQEKVVDDSMTEQNELFEDDDEENEQPKKVVNQ